MRYQQTNPISLLLLFCFFILMNLQGFGQSTPDPGLPGPYAVTKVGYNLGDMAFKPPSFADTVELRGSIHYPTLLSGGPFPVLVFLHGRHTTIFQTSNPANDALAWPPPAGWESVTSFEGYDTLASLMASHGYVVVSISANGINASDASSFDAGMSARGELVQRHLDLLNTYNTIGGAPFGTLFVGKLDMQNIGTMGHSRGGEGVVFNALYNRSLGSPYGIKAVLTLAPVDFSRRVLNGIALLNIAPYCDGDVSNIQGVHFYDDARYTDPADTTPKFNVLMLGANHNFYNTVWTPGLYIAATADDWNDYVGSSLPYCGTLGAGSKRLTPIKQRAALNTYAAAFYRQYIGHETDFAPILEVEDIIPPVSSRLDSTSVFVSYHPTRFNRLDINRTDTSIRITTNTLGDSVKSNSLLISAICGGGLSMTSCGISSSSTREPHKGSSGVKGLAQMNMKWNSATDYYQNNIPSAYKNISAYKSILFRTSINYVEYTGGLSLDYSLQITDSIGNSASVKISDYTEANFYPPGVVAGYLPKIMFNSVRIPLSAYTGIDITKVKNVKFLFDRSAAGGILISDLTFTGQEDQCGLVNTRFGYDSIGGYNTNFFDSSVITTGASLSWSWIFGDPTTGAANTSTLQNPSHAFSGDGTYNVCLAINSLKTNGVTCRDTFCATVKKATQCNVIDALYSADSIGNFDIAFNDGSIVNPGDVVSWRWDFGDPASGVLDTSSLQNPMHTYPGAGTYSVCLKIRSLTNRGFNCVDSVCTDVVVKQFVDHTGIEHQDQSHIYIFPNPAKDYLDIRGAASSDIIELYNPFGQIVMSSVINNSIVRLPESLATGMYFATIITEHGKIYKKILIRR